MSLWGSLLFKPPHLLSKDLTLILLSWCIKLTFPRMLSVACVPCCIGLSLSLCLSLSLSPAPGGWSCSYLQAGAHSDSGFTSIPLETHSKERWSPRCLAVLCAHQPEPLPSPSWCTWLYLPELSQLGASYPFATFESASC